MTIAHGHQAPTRFELVISCLLDRRFNQLSHGAEVLAVSVICSVVKTCKSFNHFLICLSNSLVQPSSLGQVKQQQKKCLHSKLVIYVHYGSRGRVVKATD